MIMEFGLRVELLPSYLYSELQMTIIDSLINSLKLALDKPHSEVIIAYSGGLDSSCLLYACQYIFNQPSFLNTLNLVTQSKPVLKAIHIDHGLSDNAETWAEHCQSQCDSLGLPLIIAKATLDLNSGLGIEAEARKARYQLLSDLSCQNALVVTGQHLDDQAETFLLNLKRGSGPKGLACMPSQRVLKGTQDLLRPLLNITRAELEHYAASNGIVWVEDESNQDNKFDRNFLRNEVLPSLNQRWPSFSRTVGRSAELCADYAALADEIAEQDLTLGIISADQLDLSPLSELSAFRLQNCLRLWFAKHNLTTPSRAMLANIIHVFIEAKSDSNPELKMDNKVLRSYRNRLYLNNLELHQSEMFGFTWDGEHSIEVSKGQPSYVFALSNEISLMRLRMPTEQEQVHIVFNVTGNTKCKPIGRSGSRAIKKLLHEYHIPPWQRSKVAYVYYNDVLVSAVGLWVCEGFSCANNELGLNIAAADCS